MASESDQNSLRQIQLCLLSYPSDPSALGRTIAQLESLHALIQDLDESWKNELVQQWGVLEELYAVALDRSAEFDEQSTKTIASAIDALRQLVADSLPSDGANGD